MTSRILQHLALVAGQIQQQVVTPLVTLALQYVQHVVVPVLSCAKDYFYPQGENETSVFEEHMQLCVRTTLPIVQATLFTLPILWGLLVRKVVICSLISIDMILNMAPHSFRVLCWSVEHVMTGACFVIGVINRYIQDVSFCFNRSVSNLHTCGDMSMLNVCLAMIFSLFCNSWMKVVNDTPIESGFLSKLTYSDMHKLDRNCRATLPQVCQRFNNAYRMSTTQNAYEACHQVAEDSTINIQPDLKQDNLQQLMDFLHAPTKFNFPAVNSLIYRNNADVFTNRASQSLLDSVPSNGLSDVTQAWLENPSEYPYLRCPLDQFTWLQRFMISFAPAMSKFFDANRLDYYLMQTCTSKIQITSPVLARCVAMYLYKTRSKLLGKNIQEVALEDVSQLVTPFVKAADLQTIRLVCESISSETDF